MGADQAQATVRVRWVIALGSNVADPAAALGLAWSACVAALDLASPQLSTLHVTAPAEQASGPLFANAVGVGWSHLDPLFGLAQLQRIEHAFGRDRAREGFHGARPLDLDLIDVGGQRWLTPPLELPHPRWFLRSFVVLPLAEVAGDLCDQEGRSAEQLARAWASAVPAERNG